MIATIKASNITSLKKGLFKAMLLGVEAEPHADLTFDIIVHDQKKADIIANSAGGKIIAVADKIPLHTYSLVDEMGE